MAPWAQAFLLELQSAACQPADKAAVSKPLAHQLLACIQHPQQTWRQRRRAHAMQMLSQQHPDLIDFVLAHHPLAQLPELVHSQLATVPEFAQAPIANAAAAHNGGALRLRASPGVHGMGTALPWLPQLHSVQHLHLMLNFDDMANAAGADYLLDSIRQGASIVQLHDSDNSNASSAEQQLGNSQRQGIALPPHLSELHIEMTSKKRAPVTDASIKLQAARALCVDAFMRSLPQCAHLTALTLQRCTFAQEHTAMFAAALQQLRRLRKLMLTRPRCVAVGDDGDLQPGGLVGIAAALQRVTALEDFAVNSCAAHHTTSATDIDAITTALQPSLPRLHSFEFDPALAAPGVRRACTALAGAPLRHLAVSLDSATRPAAARALVQRLQHLSCLQHLAVRAAPPPKSPDAAVVCRLALLRVIAGLHQLPQLAHFAWRGAFSDAAIQRLGSACKRLPHLRSLRLEQTRMARNAAGDALQGSLLPGPVALQGITALSLAGAQPPTLLQLAMLPRLARLQLSWRGNVAGPPARSTDGCALPALTCLEVLAGKDAAQASAWRDHYAKAAPLLSARSARA